MSEYIITGRIGTVYGIKGWLKVHSFTEEAFQILRYNPWYLTDGSTWQAFELETGQPQGKGVVVKFAGIETPETARVLINKKIAVKREQLKPLPPHEYYWADLVNLIVVNQKGETLGQIVRLLATGSNDVLVVKNKNNKEHAIPYLPGKVVKQVDLDKGIMLVDWELL